MDPASGVGRALAARPDLCLNPERTLVVAAGKAAAGMLRGACGDGAPLAASRAVVLLPEHADPGSLPATTTLLRGGHPVPTDEGIAASRRILDEVRALGAGHRLLLLLSGGASALLECPVAGLPNDDLRAAHRLLVGSGLAIGDINLVRSRLSLVKAGGLAAAAAPAEVATMAISDVDGDDPAVIGSGPTVPLPLPPPDAARRAREAVARAGLELPGSVRRLLEQDGAGPPTAPAPDYEIVARVEDAVAAAAAELESRGYAVRGDEARERLRGDTVAAAGRIHAALASARPPAAIVAGGETTVVLPPGAAGRGGRNLDLAARVALGLRGRGDVAVLVAGTDGRDGSSVAAGAVVDGDSAGRAEAAGRPLRDALAAFDTEPALRAAGDLVETGPTGTNVGDLVVALAG